MAIDDSLGIPKGLGARLQAGMRRALQVNVKMNPDDFSLLKKAAEKRWPDAVMTNSGIVLGLAKIAAKATLTKKSLTNR